MPGAGVGFLKARSYSRPRRRKLRKDVKLSVAGAGALTTAVKKIVSRQSETKYVATQLNVEPTAIYGDILPTGGYAQMWQVFPNITEGTSEYQRTGVKINPVKHTVDLDLRFNNLLLI